MHCDLVPRNGNRRGHGTVLYAQGFIIKLLVIFDYHDKLNVLCRYLELDQRVTVLNNRFEVKYVISCSFLVSGVYLRLQMCCDVCASESVENLICCMQVITELLNIIREHDNHLHMTRLEWIVIWLIVVEVWTLFCRSL